MNSTRNLLPSAILALTAALLIPELTDAQQFQSRLQNLKTSSQIKFQPQVQESKPDVRKMVSVLRGNGSTQRPSPSVKSTSPTPTINAPVIVERTTKIAPQVRPKGYTPPSSAAPMAVKKGRSPGSGTPTPVPVPDEEKLSSKTLYMKQGRTPAESTPPPVYATRVKDGWEQAHGEPPTPRPYNTRPSSSPEPEISGYRPGSSGGYPSAAPTQLSYRVDSSSKLSTSTVKFLKGSTELADQASYDYLLSLSSALQSPELLEDRFVVEGHASAEGSDYANLLLSQQRANAIFDFLLSRGVSPARLLAVGHGESQARFADHEPEFLRAQDRQVVVFKLAE
jgi:outer membrane protein OmpA-like peptidoglycan-associated protein